MKKKAASFNPLEEGLSSFRQLDSPGNTSARSNGLTAEVLPAKPTDAVVVSIPIVPHWLTLAWNGSGSCES